MNSDIFILARLSSDRLPNKHLMNINGKPAIKNLIERLRHSKARKIVVCTTNLKSDDPLVEYLKKEQIPSSFVLGAFVMRYFMTLSATPKYRDEGYSLQSEIAESAQGQNSFLLT